MDKYANKTFNDRNPFKRLIQKKRLKSAIGKHSSNNTNILDFGCGNGELYFHLKHKFINFHYTGFDPTERMIKEARENLKNEKSFDLFDDKDRINKKFDYIYCLEVFEHIPENLILKELNYFKKVIKKEAKIIIGVPNEIYLSALVRGLFRMTRRFGKIDANIKNVFLATIGFPPKNRIINEKKNFFKDNHIGFDHRQLIKIVKKVFTIKKIYGSPFPYLPVFLNTEVIIECTLNEEKIN